MPNEYETRPCVHKGCKGTNHVTVRPDQRVLYGCRRHRSFRCQDVLTRSGALRPSSYSSSSGSSPKRRNRRSVVFLTNSLPQSTAAKDLATLHGTGGQLGRSLPDPSETLRRPAMLLSACTQRRRNPTQAKKVPAKMPAAKTVPIACNGLCLTVCFASSIASSAA